MNTITLEVNGKKLSAATEPRTHLADFLRESHHLTGTHVGCEHGVCGACTILVDGVPTRSCITFAVACDHAEVTTVEGLDQDEIATELRTAFTREHALQCGYCTPGMIISARDVVLRLPNPSEHDIRVAMSGNLCRCTGYVGIIRAIQSVVEARRGRGIAGVVGGGRTVLGPAGSGHAAAMVAAEVAVRPARSNQASTAGRTVRRDPDWTPQARFEQSFTVSHSVDRVWDFFGSIPEVAACLPGAAIDGEPVGGRVEGRMRVKVGPISAEFEGVAEVTRDEATRTGTIDGSGKDQRSQSATRGRIVYAVRPAEQPDQTRVDLTIGYALTGMLAQFTRSGLVQDVASRLIAAFVRNLDVRLAGDAGDRGPAAEFNAGSLLASVLLGRLKRLFAGIFGSR